MRRFLVALLFALVLAAAASDASANSSAALPASWPHHLVLGVSDQPGDAQRLRRTR